MTPHYDEDGALRVPAGRPPSRAVQDEAARILTRPFRKIDRREPEETNNTTQPKGNPHANR